MAYSKFKIGQIEENFGVSLTRSKENLFEEISIPPSEWLEHSLQFSKKVSLLSEKARSEMIVSPIL